VREADGPALSSRNRLLSKPSRALAAHLFEALTTLDSPAQVRRALEDEGFDVQYVEEHEGRRFAAVVLDDVRLIDNVPLAAAPSQ
jgi:pantoate--beta-alanine ligase